jgi:uncharacterized LabA/DUF88 family protein
MNPTSQTSSTRIAVFIDFDNVEIGVKSTIGSQFDIGVVLEAIKERGEIVTKVAYSDWKRAGDYSRLLTQHAIRMVQRNMTPGGDKNGADINLALDALEMALTHPHINAFAIVGGDSDFISLVEKLKQYDKKVFVVGGRQFTSGIMQRNCHEFIAYENLANVGGGTRRGGGRDERPERAGSAGLDQVIPLVKRAMKVLSERDVEPQLGLFKSTMLQLDSTFSERTYGAGSFRDFAQKLEKAGVLTVEHTASGWIVGPANGGAPDEAPAPAEPETPRRTERPARRETREKESEKEPGDATAPEPASKEPLGTAAEGVRELASILASAEVRRWPLYLRNVKQLIRQTRPAFDERAYGFANLADLLRAAHRDNIVRVDRDRQGVIRVFQGSAKPPVAAGKTPSNIYDVENDPTVAAALAAAEAGIRMPLEPADLEPAEPRADPAEPPASTAAEEPVEASSRADAGEPDAGGARPKAKGSGRRTARKSTAPKTPARTRRPRKTPAKG